MAAMIARRDVYMRAYGQPKKALVHAPATFGGIGEACCTSIEALNILFDEGLIDNAAVQGAYLLERLNALKAKYPRIIHDVRGRGLLVGLEFSDISNTLSFGFNHVVSLLDDKLKGSLSGFVGSLLLADHNVLVAFTEYNRNVIRLAPPLIAQREHIDTFVGALDQVLSRGIARIVLDYVRTIERR
jgi:acetylornithine/succinyldiaminopimelate/putrescine aminotransferase